MLHQQLRAIRWRAAIEHVRSTGIAQLELAIKTQGVPSIFGEEPILTDASSTADVQAVQELLAEHGLELSSCNITSGNPLLDEVVELTKRKLQIAKALRVSLVVAGAGEAQDGIALRRLEDHLRRIADCAGELGITYCCETHPGLCQDADRMLETMSRLDHPQLALNFDTGNLLFYNEGRDPVAELRRVMPFVRHLHLKDHNGRLREWCFPALGCGGGVDFAGVREVLEAARYTGPCSLEIEGIQGEAPPSLGETRQRIVDSVLHLRACGFPV